MKIPSPLPHVLAAVALAAIASGSSAQAVHDSHTMMQAGDLKWAPLPSIAGAMAATIEGPASKAGPFTMRLKLPANAKIPPHFHPGIEHVTVMSGTFHLGHGEKFDESKLTALPAGSIAIMQPKSPHFATVKEETIVQLHGMGPWSVVYVNPADDPSKKH